MSEFGYIELTCDQVEEVFVPANLILNKLTSPTNPLYSYKQVFKFIIVAATGYFRGKHRMLVPIDAYATALEVLKIKK